MPQLIIIGASGYVGRHLTENLGIKGLNILRTERNPREHDTFCLDLENPKTLEDFSRIAPDYLGATAILSAAMSRVDDCKADLKRAEAINLTGTKMLLEIFYQNSIRPVFFSSDFVFDGNKQSPLETDSVSPITVYGRQKAEIESYIQSNFTSFLILRTSKILSLRSHSRNPLQHWVNQFRQNRIVRAFRDQWITPILLEDLCEGLIELLATSETGVYHFACQSALTQEEFGHQLIEAFQLQKDLMQPCLRSEVKLLEPRPKYSCLGSEKLRTICRISFSEIPEMIERFKRANP